MDPQMAQWLEDGFFAAFPGNQKQIFPMLRFKYNLEFRGRSYRDAWDELIDSYGEDHLASVVKEEITSRVSKDAMDQIRQLFWADELPQVVALEALDRRNFQSWVETLSGPIDGEMQHWVIQWSPVANLWFQRLDPSPPSEKRPEPPPRAGAYTAGIDSPGPLFKRWLECKGAVITEVDAHPADSLVAVTRKNMYVLKYWSGATPPTSPNPADFVQNLLDSLEDLRRSPVGRDRGVFPIACSLTGFTPEAQDLAKEHGVELWGKDGVIANWMRAGAIGIAYDNGHWYVVGAASSKPRAHLTPMRRVRYS